MANNITSFTTPTGDTNFDAITKTIQEQAAKTRKVVGPKGTTDLSMPTLGISGLKKKVGELPTEAKAAMTGAMQQYEQGVKTLQEQAEKSATSLEMMGGAVTEALRGYEEAG